MAGNVKNVKTVKPLFVFASAIPELEKREGLDYVDIGYELCEAMTKALAG